MPRFGFHIGSYGEVLGALKSFDARLSAIEGLLHRQEKRMSEFSNEVQRLKREAGESKVLLDKLLAWAKTVPDLIRKAVEDAIAASDTATAEDLAGISEVANELDRQQQDIAAGLPPGTPTVEPPVEEPPTTEEPGA